MIRSDCFFTSKARNHTLDPRSFKLPYLARVLDGARRRDFRIFDLIHAAAKRHRYASSWIGGILESCMNPIAVLLMPTTKGYC